MRILYGVVGEGMGHATRSRVMLESLAKKHDVHIVVSGRAQKYLAEKFESVHGIWGLSIAYEGNHVKTWQTMLENFKGAITGWPKNIREYFDLVHEFKPDVVISDFESFSYLFAKNRFLPVVSVDNMQVLNRCAHDPSLLRGHEDNFEMSRSIVKSKLPGCFHYLVTTFFYPALRKERTTLVPSILRPEILAAKPERGEHLLVYQSATSNSGLPAILKQAKIPCRVYGLRRDLTEEQTDGNVTYCPFSETKFIEDLRTSRAVLAGGGFTLMSEAVYLHKPMLSVPIEGQFEQTLNALYLQQLGYGGYAQALTAQRLTEFLDRVDACHEALQGYEQDGNVKTLAALEEQLARAAEHKGKWAEVSHG